MFDLLRTLKLLCQMFWKDKLSFLDELHLGTLLNMLKSAHYNARMNSLKEVSVHFFLETPTHFRSICVKRPRLIKFYLLSYIFGRHCSL